MAAVAKDVVQQLQERASKSLLSLPSQPLSTQGNTAIHVYGGQPNVVNVQLGGTLVPLTSNLAVTTKHVVDLPEATPIEVDFYAWLYRQASILRQLRPNELDWENLAEELEDMGQNLKRSLASHLAHVFQHLLKLQYEPNPAYRANEEHRWKVDLAAHRDEVNDILDGSGSLRKELVNFIPKAYRRGCKYAGLEMLHLPGWQNVFPSECPWSIERIRDENFFPSPRESSNGHH